MDAAPACSSSTCFLNSERDTRQLDVAICCLTSLFSNDYCDNSTMCLCWRLLAAEIEDRDQVQEQLSASYKGRYDSAAGVRLRQEVLLRSPDAPIELTVKDADELGARFPLANGQYMYEQIAQALVDQERRLQQYIEQGGYDSDSAYDSHSRSFHILQYAGAPGTGKTTAARLSFILLQQALQDPQKEAALDVQMQEQQQQQYWEKVTSRVKTSFDPDHLLLFTLDLSKAGEWTSTGGPHGWRLHIYVMSSQHCIAYNRQQIPCLHLHRPASCSKAI